MKITNSEHNPVPQSLTNAHLLPRWQLLACSRCFQTTWCRTAWLMAGWCLPLIPQECHSQALLILLLMAGHYTPLSSTRMRSTRRPMEGFECRSLDPSWSVLDIHKVIPSDRWRSHRSRHIFSHSVCLVGCHFLMAYLDLVEVWRQVSERMTWIVQVTWSKPSKCRPKKQSRCQHPVSQQSRNLYYPLRTAQSQSQYPNNICLWASHDEIWGMFWPRNK